MWAWYKLLSFFFIKNTDSLNPKSYMGYCSRSIKSKVKVMYGQLNAAVLKRLFLIKL